MPLPLTCDQALADARAALEDHRRAGAPTYECTGLTAAWCPVHGDCACSRGRNEGLDCDLDDPKCPLHAPTSEHPIEVSSAWSSGGAPPREPRLAEWVLGVLEPREELSSQSMLEATLTVRAMGASYARAYAAALLRAADETEGRR